ncbi:MAG: hypothetical protein KatS3mg039_1389 [Candidatus Kapaibacterium sp.]|nr:MAG: hypothetical protein KatS3mg039_1389 [Candidatus Kapabacteria bacterium]
MMRSMCLFLCVLLAGGAVQAQDSSDVLWAKYAYEPLRTYHIGYVQQLGVYWHWSDSVLIVSDLVQGEHRVFEIDVRRGVAVREVEELRGKGVLAVLPDTPIVYTRVPYFGKADYRTGRLLDTLRDVPPQGLLDVVVCPLRRQLLGWEEVVGNGVSSSGAARLLLYSLDSMRLVDTIPIPRHLPYGLQAGVPRGEQHYLELYWYRYANYGEARSPGLLWTDDGRYLHLVLEEHWQSIGPDGITQDTYRLRLWLIDVAGRRVVGQMEYSLHDIRGGGGARGYVGNTGSTYFVFDSSMRIVRIFPNGGVLSFALSPDGRYVMGGTRRSITLRRAYGM